MSRTFPIYPACPVCGDPAVNRAALGVRWIWDDDQRRVFGRFTPGPDHAGYAGRMHGGILSALLDECMAWACAVQRHGYCLTGDLHVRFKCAAKLGEPIEIRAAARDGWGPYLRANGEATSLGGELLASAVATFAMLAPEESMRLRAGLRFEPGDLDVLSVD
jgi:acyl-coenzyme A thioesterase PaaI-like protein